MLHLTPDINLGAVVSNSQGVRQGCGSMPFSWHKPGFDIKGERNGNPLCSKPGSTLGSRPRTGAPDLCPPTTPPPGLGGRSCLTWARCGNSGRNPCSPPSQKLFLVCVSLWGEDKGGNDQKLKLANCKQLRPGIRGQLRITVCSLWP